MSDLTVAISGARGFVGSRLASVLAPRARVIGLTRGRSVQHAEGPVNEWRRCDLFSYEDAYAALESVDVAFYLVHAMMPSARLTQARFEDLDALSADNFARAAKARGVRQIVYLGGLIPEGVRLSSHLESRREVERVLAAPGVPLTVLRAGLVVGATGSSFQMMTRLVRRLPVMICPAWMRMRTQPIDLDDVVQLLSFCVDREQTFGQTYDIGGPEVMSYQQMVEATARALGKERKLVPIGLLSTGLSCLWVSLVTGAPRALVRPLIDSLNHETVARDRRLQELAGVPGKTFAESLTTALGAQQRERSPKRERPRAFVGEQRESASDARSVQRLPLPPGFDAERVAREYEDWLVRFLPILRARRTSEHVVTFHLAPLAWWPLLVLAYSPTASTEHRALLYVAGGALARPYDRGRLEFTRVPDRAEVLAAVHDFHPRLPWWLYLATQALVHRWVMYAFGRHLERIGRGVSTPAHAA
jgi:uncharacterized protein YbjT (DUF2867 family)